MQYLDEREGDYVLRVWGNGTAVSVLDTKTHHDLFLQGDEAIEFLCLWDGASNMMSFETWIILSGFGDILRDSYASRVNWPEYL